MHELSIAMALLEVAGEEAQRHGSARVVAIHARVGPLSGVMAEALTGAYELAREGTAFEGCRLVVEQTDITGKCTTCDAVRGVVAAQDLRCAACGEVIREILTGRELELTAMEVES